MIVTIKSYYLGHSLSSIGFVFVLSDFYNLGFCILSYTTRMGEAPECPKNSATTTEHSAFMHSAC